MLIRDIQVKPLTKKLTYREGTVFCKPFDTELLVHLFDEDVTLEYAERCAEAMNEMPPELLEAICKAAKLYCNTYRDDIGEDLADEMTVPIDENSPASEIMKCFKPTVFIVETPEDPSRIGYQLSCECDWEEEHGMEIDILDDRLVYLSEYNGDSPWVDHSGEDWNYAAKII